MKKILFAALLLLVGCTPVRYVYVDPKDSTIKKQRVIYDDLYIPTPLFFNYGWNSRFYNPIIIQRQRPIVIQPKRTQPSVPIRKFEPRKR